MEEKVILACQAEAARRKKVERLYGLIEVRRRNMLHTERYLGLYGDCLSEQKVAYLKKHLRETEHSLRQMINECNEMMSAISNPPQDNEHPYALQ